MRKRLGSIAVVVMSEALLAQSGWQALSPATQPSARAFHAAAQDVANGRMVLFGGWNNGTYLGDTWLWDGAAWLQASPALSPSPRLAAAMTYDLVRGRVVLFGGAIGGGAGTDDDETWEWDGTNWTMLTPAVRPSARRSASMTFDLARGVAVLFGGGVGSSGTPSFGDTWEWNGTTWTQRLPATSPSPRWDCCLVADLTRDNVVLFGGSDGALGPSLDDTWIWNGVDWQQQNPVVSATPRRGGASTFDWDRSVTVLFSGLINPGFAQDTWLWDGATWRLDTRPQGPADRRATSFTYDPARHRATLVGGIGSTAQQDQWEYQTAGMSTWSALGPGCAGGAGTPGLTQVPGSYPVAGGVFYQVIDYGTAPGTGLALLAIGTSDQQWAGGALPAALGAIGMPGCLLRVSTDWLGVVLLTNGIGSFDWLLPANPAIVGLPFHSQALVFDAGANPFGAVLSDAATGVVGTF